MADNIDNEGTNHTSICQQKKRMEEKRVNIPTLMRVPHSSEQSTNGRAIEATA
jgi:hypothetical protein